MALMEKIVGKEAEEVCFILTGITNNSMYIKTTKYSDASELINLASDKGLKLKQVNTEADREPIAYAPGFFISAQVIKSSVISPNQHKVWEIV